MQRSPPVLKATYTVPELAELAGMRRKNGRADGTKMLRLLRQASVPVVSQGPRQPGFVYLSQLRRCAPDLWDSIVESVSVAA